MRLSVQLNTVPDAHGTRVMIAVHDLNAPAYQARPVWSGIINVEVEPAYTAKELPAFLVELFARIESHVATANLEKNLITYASDGVRRREHPGQNETLS